MTSVAEAFMRRACDNSWLVFCVSAVALFLCIQVAAIEPGGAKPAAAEPGADPMAFSISSGLSQ